MQRRKRIKMDEKQDCMGCKFEELKAHKHPCNSCKRNEALLDWWEPKE